MKDVISVSSAARMKGKLKRRWPLNEAIICVGKGQKEKLESLSELLISQLNVEKFSIVETEKQTGLEQILELKQLNLPAKPVVELERKRIGPKAKQHMGALVKTFEKVNPEEIISSLQKSNSFEFNIEETQINLDTEDFVIDFDGDKNFAVAKRDDYVVFISTLRNKEMMAKRSCKRCCTKNSNTAKRKRIQSHRCS